MTVRLYFVRDLPGMGECDRVCHLVNAPGDGRCPESLAACCGRSFVVGDFEWLLAPVGAPCARCVNSAWLRMSGYGPSPGGGDAA